MEGFNYYNLLGVPPDATKEEITDAYKEKIVNASSEVMSEKYKTAYITLRDNSKRCSYNKSIGIHKYRKVSLPVRAARIIGIIILTLLDVACTFYLCFFIAFIWVLFAYSFATKIYQGEINIAVLDEIISLFGEEKLVFGCMYFNIVLFYFKENIIRRANRKLKAVNWEVRGNNDKEA